MKKIFVVFLFMLLAASSAFAEGQFVQRVIDANTLRLLNGEHVRLLGFTVPEENSKAAADYVRSLVSGSVVALEYDVDKTDDEGNMLAYVWFRYEPRMREDQVIFPSEFDVHYVVDGKGEGEFFVLLNTTVVKAGFGEPAKDFTNTKYAQLIEKLYEERPIKTVKADNETHASLSVE